MYVIIFKKNQRALNHVSSINIAISIKAPISYSFFSRKNNNNNQKKTINELLIRTSNIYLSIYIYDSTPVSYILLLNSIHSYLNKSRKKRIK